MYGLSGASLHSRIAQVMFARGFVMSKPEAHYQTVNPMN
jgi:hypothetical protein